jgi:hypothetical protein
MAEFLASGRLVDVVIAFTLLEFMLLLTWRKLRGGGLPPVDLAFALGGGLCLMFALRAALLASPWQSVVVPLIGAGLIHALDLRRRWSR